jgi:hypothetical protein
MNNKAQGTIEYLVIIAIVVVIALVVVGLLLQILGNFGSVSETGLKTAWKSAEPWAITDWSASGDTLTVVLKNNTAETLDLTEINVGVDTNDTHTDNVAPGATVVKTIADIGCTAGSRYSLPKADITVGYDTESISGRTQYANADIAGTC